MNDERKMMMIRMAGIVVMGLVMLLIAMCNGYGQTVTPRVEFLGQKTDPTKASNIKGLLFVRDSDGHLYFLTGTGMVRIDTSISFVDSTRAAWKTDTLWGDIASTQVTYYDVNHLSLPTVWDALDSLLNPYVAPSVNTLTVTSSSPSPHTGEGNATREMGVDITSSTLSYTVTAGSYPIATTTLSWSGNGSGSVSPGGSPYVHSNSYTTDSTTRTYTLQITTTLPANASRNTTVTFAWRRHVGNSANDTLTADELRALSDSTLYSSLSFSGTETFSNTRKFVAYPSTYGLAGTFKIDGFTTSAWDYQTLNIVNAYGKSCNYYIYRTPNKLNGSHSWQVSQ